MNELRTTHTPGPWGFGRTGEDRRMVLGDNGAGRYVCTVQIHQTPRAAGLNAEAEREANARLIAAAPEMLDALKEAVDLIENHTMFDASPLRELISKASVQS